MTSTIRLSIPQILEALGNDNKFYASRHYGQDGNTLTYEQLLSYYTANSTPGMSVYGYDVVLPAGDMGQMTFEDITQTLQHRM